MAIYQYKIELIPRQSIVEKYGEIPTQLFIDQEGWQRHWEKADIEGEHDFEDALTIPWWTERKIPFKELESFIGTFTKPVEWSKDFTDSKSYGNNDTNDFSIGLTTDGFIEDFGCRFDLRELDNNFIEHIFIIAKRLDCLIMDRKAKLFEPIFDKLIENIKESNSFKFVTDPTGFFDNLSSGKISLE